MVLVLVILLTEVGYHSLNGPVSSLYRIHLRCIGRGTLVPSSLRTFSKIYSYIVFYYRLSLPSDTQMSQWRHRSGRCSLSWQWRNRWLLQDLFSETVLEALPFLLRGNDPMRYVQVLTTCQGLRLEECCIFASVCCCDNLYLWHCRQLRAYFVMSLYIPRQ